VWWGYVEEWDRSLRAANKPLTTRYNYELAVTQLAEFLVGEDLPEFLASSGWRWTTPRTPPRTQPKDFVTPIGASTRKSACRLTDGLDR
jgi:hypothetical protein